MELKFIIQTIFELTAVIAVIYGCAIMRAAADRIEELSASPWISVKDRLPELEDVFLVIVDGKPKEKH